MKNLVARSMEEGAWGLVTRFESGGPEYPGEIIEMAKVAASYGGIYMSHIGSEGVRAGEGAATSRFVSREEAEAAGPHLSPEDPRRRTTGAQSESIST